MSNFRKKYMTNEISIEKLDDFIDDWHNSPGSTDLQTFLGLTDEEFNACSKGETELKKVLDAAKKYKSVGFLNKVEEYHATSQENKK